MFLNVVGVRPEHLPDQLQAAFSPAEPLETSRLSPQVPDLLQDAVLDVQRGLLLVVLLWGLKDRGRTTCETVPHVLLLGLVVKELIWGAN